MHLKGYHVAMASMHVAGSSDDVPILHVLSPAPRNAWREVLKLDPFAYETQSPEWTDAMCTSRGYVDASRLYEFVGGRRVVLPLLRRRFAGVVVSEASNPLHCGVGGILAAGGPQPGDITAVLGELSRRAVARRSFLPHPLVAEAWAEAWAEVNPPGGRVVARRAHVIDLDGGPAAVAKRFGKLTHRGIRHAQRSGVAVECGTSGRLVDEFFDLMQLATIRWARTQHEPRSLALGRLRWREPRSKFKAIGRHLGDRMQIWLARVGDRPVAATLVLRGSNAYYLRGAMDEEMRSYRANDLLHVTAIEDACAAGCRYYYLGDSGWSENLAKFKERLGAQPIQYAEYRSERLPFTQVESVVKTVVKRAIRFKDF
jgi:hypothetical protein